MLRALLDGFFSTVAPLSPGDRIVVAFSGGTDSTALLLGLAPLARRRGAGLVAAHLDHGLDPGSAGRAAAASRRARSLGLPFVGARIEVARERRRGESVEAAARRLRYAWLDGVAAAEGARWVATAHHRDDQIETVLLRLAFGTGPSGLAGIAPRQGRLVRPLLAVGRRELELALAGELAAAAPAPLDDPTNLDLDIPRNRVRHLLRPRLEAAEPDLGRRLLSLATAARGAGARLERELAARLGPRVDGGRVTVERRRLEALPSPLLPWALAALHRAAGLTYPPAASARRELERQLAAGGEVGCDCGGGWRWRGRGGELALERHAAPAEPFARRLVVPGAVRLPELGLELVLSRRPVAAWMLGGERHRAGLELALSPGDKVTVRSRRPGDRVRPLGLGGGRRLKQLLIDRKVPRAERDRLPLLVVDGRIVWVPGVTIDDGCRIRGAKRVWVAELRPDGRTGAPAARAAMR